MKKQKRKDIYFLKIISKGNKSLKNLLNICSGFDKFGRLGSKIYYETSEWVFLSFDPYSIERGDQKAEYKTDPGALGATIQHLSDIGYQTKVINFEEIISKL